MSGGNTVHLQTEPFLYIDRYSDDRTWGGEAPPREGDSVYVPKGMNLLMDISTPKLYSIIVEGSIKFSDERDMTVDTSYFIVNGG